MYIIYVQPTRVTTNSPGIPIICPKHRARKNDVFCSWLGSGWADSSSTHLILCPMCGYATHRDRKHVGLHSVQAAWCIVFKTAVIMTTEYKKQKSKQTQCDISSSRALLRHDIGRRDWRNSNNTKIYYWNSTSECVLLIQHLIQEYLQRTD
jgi:hypothetical protein